MKKTLISIFILICLGLQTWVVFNPPGGNRGAYFWPFTDYPMYRESFEKGDIVKLYTLHGVISESEIVTIDSSHMGLNSFTFTRGPVRALLNNSKEKISFFAELYQARQQKKLLGFLLKEHSWKIDKHGLEPLPDQVIREVVL